MADFCKACSIELFGEDAGDLAGLVTVAEVRRGYRAAVICEDCGYILVNHLGECTSCDLKKGQEGHDMKGGRLWRLWYSLTSWLYAICSAGTASR